MFVVEIIMKHDDPDDKAFMKSVADAIFGNHSKFGNRFLVIDNRVALREKDDRLIIEIATEDRKNYLLKFDLEDLNIDDI